MGTTATPITIPQIENAAGMCGKCIETILQVSFRRLLEHLDGRKASAGHFFAGAGSGGSGAGLR